MARPERKEVSRAFREQGLHPSRFQQPFRIVHSTLERNTTVFIAVVVCFVVRASVGFAESDFPEKSRDLPILRHKERAPLSPRLGRGSPGDGREVQRRNSSVSFLKVRARLP
ncbi:hypothetical protein TRVL_10282 [Trypanosoma vivax]|nr:hypothetical protein TRVL_10282 [Trypanosoma vivax]